MDTQHRWPAAFAGIVMAFVLGGAGVKAEDKYPIFDTVSGWREAGHPMREFEITRSLAKDSTGRMERPSD